MALKYIEKFNLKSRRYEVYAKGTMAKKASV